MSSGGGKGGKKEEKTTIPDWVRGPAERNLRRAEQVQQLKYMPYTGPQVAAFNETQNAAMNNNIGAAKAFGLLDPNSTLTATSGMPTPTEFDGGFKGYSSIGLYDQALKELTARDPANMNAYNNLFGNVVPANVARGGGGGGRGGGGASPAKPAYNPYNPNTWSTKDRVAHERQVDPGSYVSQLDSAYGQKSTYVPKAKDIAHQNAVKAKKAKALTGNYRKRSSLYGGL
jgi:hypothetical protein